MLQTTITKYFLFLLFLSGVGLTSAQTSLASFVNHPAFKHASVGVSVVDMETGMSIMSHNIEKSLTPASTMKLLTTATALELLGDNYRFKTEVMLDANDPSRILVMGAGDPTLGSEAFKEDKNGFFIHCAEALRKALPNDKEYAIYVVDDLFGYDGVSSAWTWIDMGNYYAAGAYGISVFDNTYRLFFNTTDKNSCPRILRTEPEIKELSFLNLLSLNTSGRDNGYIYGAPFSFDRSVKGDIPSGRNEFSIKGDIPDPGLLLGQTLADYLRRTGMRVGKVETAREDYFSAACSGRHHSAYRAGKVIFSHLSPPLKEVIREVNVESNNHYAEHLVRIIGRELEKDIYTDALEEGIEYVRDHWKKKGLDVSPLQMYDGCGLAPQNAVSAKFMTDMLVYLYTQSNYAEVFFNSLPKAGREGTLQYFLRNTRLTGRVAAKSGSIGGVHCYAGYLLDGNKKYAFTVMVNKFNGPRSRTKEAIEQLLLSIARN